MPAFGRFKPLAYVASAPVFWSAYKLARRGISPVFVCGCGHTGTTWLASALGTHPGIYCPPYETSMFTPTRWHKIAGEFAATARAGRRVLVEKTPAHIYQLPVIRRSIADARFVMTMRDGRETATSLFIRFKDWDYAVSRWVNAAERIAENAEARDAIVVRYEDLVEDFRGAMERVLSFIGLPYAPEVEDPALRRWTTSSGVIDAHMAARRAQIAREPVRAPPRWPELLPAAQLKQLTTGRGGELMQRFGYG